MSHLLDGASVSQAVDQFVVRGFISKGMLDHLKMELGLLHAREPYQVQLHPRYGDPRPQRIPAKNFQADDLFGRDLARNAEEELGRRMGRRAHSKERYFIHYPPGTKMHKHTDPDPRGDHWRCGVVIRKPHRGGILFIDDTWHSLEEGDAYFFNAGKIPHGVSEVTEGVRDIFTIALFL